MCLWFTDMFQNLENVELARDMQDMRIRKKKRQTIRPLPGSLFLTKTSGVSRIPLKAAVNGKLPAGYTQKQAMLELSLDLFCLSIFCCIWLKYLLLCKQCFIMIFLYFSCMNMEFISMCLRSPVRLQKLFASICNSSSNWKHS